MKTLENPARRGFFKNTGATALSAAAIAVLGGVAVPKGARAAPTSDVTILNTAIALEYEGVGAYDIAIGSGLLQQGVKDTATLFRGHHREHAEGLAKVIRTLGGKPAEPKTLDEYAKELGAASLKNQGDIIKLALKLERGAAEGYLGLIPSFSDPRITQTMARIAADEALHWTVLTVASGGALPKKALSFGA